MFLFILWLYNRGLTLLLYLWCSLISSGRRNHNSVVITGLLTSFSCLFLQKRWTCLCSLSYCLHFFSMLSISLVTVGCLSIALLLKDCEIYGFGFRHILLLMSTQIMMRSLFWQVNIGWWWCRLRCISQPRFTSHSQFLHSQLESIRLTHIRILVGGPEWSGICVCIVDWIISWSSIWVVRNHLFTIVFFKASVPTWNIQCFKEWWNGQRTLGRFICTGSLSFRILVVFRFRGAMWTCSCMSLNCLLKCPHFLNFDWLAMILNLEVFSAVSFRSEVFAKLHNLLL